MKRLSFYLSAVLIFFFVSNRVSGSGSVSFTVVTYNVENLFDVDGIAMFDDYKLQDEGSVSGYTRAKFFTKLKNTAKVLQSIND